MMPLRVIVGLMAFLATSVGMSPRAGAVSFSVDRPSVGLAGTALALEPPPAENDIFNAKNAANGRFLGSNVLDVPNFVLDAGGPPLPQVGPPDLNALSAGFEPLDAVIWDVVFSVDRGSVGVPGSSVALRVATGNAAASDIYFNNPALLGTNRWFTANNRLGLLNAAPPGGDNIDALEVFDSRLPGENLYDRFALPIIKDPIYFSVSGSADIFVDGPGGAGPGALFAAAAQLGLVPGDDIDALALDVGFETVGLGDGVLEVLFSLAPGSPSLALAGVSPGDVLYSNFGGAFDIAGKGLLNIHLNNFNYGGAFLDLTFANLGLWANDNLDSLDISYTSTPFNIPQNPDFPPGVELASIPVAPSHILFGSGLMILTSFYRRRRNILSNLPHRSRGTGSCVDGP